MLNALGALLYSVEGNVAVVLLAAVLWYRNQNGWQLRERHAYLFHGVAMATQAGALFVAQAGAVLNWMPVAGAACTAATALVGAAIRRGDRQGLALPVRREDRQCLVIAVCVAALAVLWGWMGGVTEPWEVNILVISLVYSLPGTVLGLMVGYLSNQQ